LDGEVIAVLVVFAIFMYKRQDYVSDKLGKPSHGIDTFINDFIQNIDDKVIVYMEISEIYFGL